MQKRSLKNLAIILAGFSMFTTVLLADGVKKGTITATTAAYELTNQEMIKGAYVVEGEKVDILEEVNDYYKVQLQDQLITYVEKEHVNVTEEEIKEEVKEEVVEQVVEQPKEEPKPVVIKEVAKPVLPKKSEGEEIVEYAKQFLGTPYVAAGNSLTKGVDCSGFTTQVYKEFGISLKRSSRDQYASNGQQVSRSELQAGDLVFYGYNGRVNHVGIYAGNDKIVHASTSNRGVVVDPITQRGMAPIIGYKRIVD